jgi:hypothetical protein
MPIEWRKGCLSQSSLGPQCILTPSSGERQLRLQGASDPGASHLETCRHTTATSDLRPLHLQNGWGRCLSTLRWWCSECCSVLSAGQSEWLTLPSFSLADRGLPVMQKGLYELWASSTLGGSLARLVQEKAILCLANSSLDRSEERDVGCGQWPGSGSGPNQTGFAALASSPTFLC